MIRPGRTPNPNRACHSADVLTPPERAAELAIKRELEMNYQRYQQIESGLSSLAKKVLGYVPISEGWPRHRIAGEIERQSGARVDPRTIDGVLSSLVDSGLIKEPKRGEFRRIEVSKPEKSCAQVAPDAPSAPTHQEKIVSSKAANETPMDKIALATSSLRSLAKQINEAASVIDDAALASQQESQKMRQLSELLKSINA